MKKIINETGLIAFILIAFLTITEWESTAQECIAGVDAAFDNSSFYCHTDYPIICYSCYTIPGVWCCPENYPMCGMGAPACCTCPSSTIFDDNSEEIKLLRNFRDEILLSSEVGKTLVLLYYDHSDEFVSIINDDPEIKAQIKRMILIFIHSIGSVLDGELFVITKIMAARINNLCDRISAKASPELKKTIETLQEEFNQGLLLKELEINTKL